MKHRTYRLLYLLLALLVSAAAGGCAKNAVESAVPSPLADTPLPRISAAAPAVSETPLPSPTAAPAQKIAYTDGIHGVIVSEVLFGAKAVRVYEEAVGFIELYNGGAKAVSLSEFCVSDRFDDPGRYPLPDITLAPGERYCFTLKGEEAQKNCELPFRLSEDDDGLLLYAPAEQLAVKYSFPVCPEKDISVIPQPNGGMLYCLYATPCAENAPAFETLEERENALMRGVYISEVSAKGAGTLELRNGGTQSVTLALWTWTDDPDEIKKEPVDTQLAAGESAVFTPQKFRISASGETLYLYDGNGFLRDTFKTGVLSNQKSSGRLPASADRVFFEVPTLGSANLEGSPALLTPAPLFSETALYHSEPFLLSLSCSDSEAVIYYTVDGTVPTQKSTRYTEPFTVNQSMSVRAVALREGHSVSPESAAHYIFGVTHTLPVMYIDMDPELFRRLTNVPYTESGLKEQPCGVYWFEADGKLGVSFPAGVKPRGNASMGYPQKSLSLHLRVQYGQEDVCCDFWNTGISGPYSALVLRNSGQDTNGCHFRDSFAHRASANMRMDTQHTRPVVVYVNGEYYGVLDLMDNMNKATFALRYGVSEDEVNIVQRNDYVNTGSAEGFVALRKYAMTNDFTDDGVVAAYAEKLDLGAVTDYIIAQSFFGNYDIHNQNYWASADGSVTWRPFLYDVDRCLNRESMKSNVLSMYFNSAGIVHNKKGDRIMMDMYCALKKNESWRSAFLRRYAYLLCNDYSTETLLKLFDEMTEEIRPEMERHTAKFKTPSSYSAWEKSIADMRQNIIDRRAVIEKNIRSVFKLSAEEWAAIIAPYEAGAPWEG